MSTLTALKLVAAKRPTTLPPVVIRRNKLVAKLWEQIQLAQCEAAGERYQPTRLRTMRDRDTGMIKTLEVPRRVKPWWWISESGKVCVSIRYGSKVLELSKGKTSIVIGGAQDLVPELETVKVAANWIARSKRPQAPCDRGSSDRFLGVSV
jgi:hypothetical protein